MYSLVGGDKMSEVSKFIFQIIFTCIFMLMLIFGKKLMPLKMRYYLFRTKENKRFFKYLKSKIKDKEKTREELKNEELLLVGIKVYDVFSNKDMNNLLKSIYKLNKNKFQLKNMFWRAKKIGEIEYIDGIKGVYKISNIGVIIPKNDPHIRSIRLSTKQINNQEFVVEFEFELSPKDENIFINRHYKLGSKEPFFEYLHEEKKYKELALNRYSLNLYQAYLNKILKLNYGRGYILPKVCYIHKKAFDLDKINRDFITQAYINTEKNMVAYRFLYEDDCYTLYTLFKDIVPTIIDVGSIDSRLYYTLFYYIEKMELKKRVNKYFNAEKKVTYKNFIWLINKLRCFDEYSRHEKNINKNYNDKYKFIYDDEEKEVDSLSIEHYKKILEEEYRAIYEYLEKIYSQQKDSKTINIALFTVILTVVLTFLTNDKFLKLFS